MDSNHDSRVSFLRGVLISLVTLGHVIQWFAYPAYQSDYLKDPLFSFIYLFHVPLFFAVSGYLVGRHARPADSWGVLAGRLLRLATPSLSWFALTVGSLTLVKMALHGPSSLSRPSAHVLLYGLGMHAWYVWCLCLFLFLTSVFTPLGKLRLPLLLLSCFACLWLPEHGILFLVQYALPFLCVGYMAATSAGLKPKPLTWPLRMLLCLLSAFIFWSWSPADSIYLQGWSLTTSSWSDVLLRFLKQLIVVILTADLLWLVSKVRFLSFFSYIGDRTLLIYLSQNILILNLIPILNRRPLEGPQYSFFVAPLVAGAFLLICLAAERLFSSSHILAYTLNGKAINKKSIADVKGGSKT